MDRVSAISVLVLGMVLLLPVVSRVLKRYPRMLRAGSLVLLVIYLVANVYLTMLSRPTRIYHHMQLTPLWSFGEAFVKGREEVREEIILNVLLYVPLGYLMHYAFPRLRSWRVIAAGVLLSGLTETVQLFFKLGLCEVDDLMTNTFGTVLGVGAYQLVHSLAEGRRRRQDKYDRAA